LGTKNGVITVQQAQPLEAVRENLAERGGIILLLFPQLSCFLSLHSQNPYFLLFKAESQQSHPSQQCLPVSSMDIESGKKSNMSNKPGFPSCATLGLRFGDCYGKHHLLPTLPED
jgi:hypothetical protein